MKTRILITIFAIATMCVNLNAQSQDLLNLTNEKSSKKIAKKDLPFAYIKEDITLHFISPEPIVSVEISNNNVVGNIPVNNVVSVKIEKDSLKNIKENDIAIVTIIAENFLAQYALKYSNIANTTQIEISPAEMTSLEIKGKEISYLELRNISLNIINKKPILKNVVSKDLGLQCRLNNIYAYGDYIFLDITYKNTTNLRYDIEDISFFIEDKKIYKATNNQSIQIDPIYSLYQREFFKHTFRNIYVFKKFTYPNNKILKVRLTEKQISGRKLDLLIEYRDLLNADTF